MSSAGSTDAEKSGGMVGPLACDQISVALLAKNMLLWHEAEQNASVFLLILVSVISRSAFFLKFALTEDWPLLLSEG